MLPNLNIGPVTLPMPALILLGGIWLGIYLTEKFAPRFGVNSSNVSSLILLMLFTGIIGARLSYVAHYPNAFLENPADVISRSPGMLDPIGGFVLAVIGGIQYGQRKGLPFWQTLDALTPGIAILAVCLGLSHLASGSAFGKPTQLPWGVVLWGEYRHPTQVYEIILAGLIFGLILPYHTYWKNAQPGVLFLGYLALSAASRLFLEAFRGDSPLLWNSIRTAQLLAWMVLALSLWGIQRRVSRKTTTNSSGC